MINFAHTELQAFLCCATSVIFSFGQSFPSLHYLFFTISLSISFIYVAKAAATSTFEIVRSVLILTIVLFVTPAFVARFNPLYLSVKSFLELVAAVTCLLIKQFVESPGCKALWQKFALRCPHFLTSEIMELHKLKTRQISQIFRVPSAIFTYAMIDSQMQLLLFNLFHNQNFLVTVLNGAWFWQLLLGNSEAMAHWSYRMSWPRALEAQLYFWKVALTRRTIERKNLKIA